MQYCARNIVLMPSQRDLDAAPRAQAVRESCPSSIFKNKRSNLSDHFFLSVLVQRYDIHIDVAWIRKNLVEIKVSPFDN